MNLYSSRKLVKNSYYGTLGVGGSTSRRISIIKRRNKLRKVYDLDSQIEDESQGYIYAPATAPRYYAPVDRVYTPGIEPEHSQVYIRMKKSEN